MTLKKKYDLTVKVIEAVETVISLTADNHYLRGGRSDNLLRHLPIDSLDAVRSVLKTALGKDYKKLYVKYRGPRPKLRLPATEENLLKIIALGARAERTPRQRASMCLKHDATHYSLYKRAEF